MIRMYRTLSLVSYLSLSCLTTVCNATSCRAGIVEASCKVYNISNIVRASSVTRWLRSLLFSSLRAVLRSNKASDILTVYCKISISYSVTLVTLDNLNNASRYRYYNTDMICTTCIISYSVIIPIIEDHISSGWSVSIILYPDTHILSKLDKMITATLSRDNICKFCLNTYSGCKSSTPRICIFYSITSREWLTSIISINNLFMGSITLFTA